MGHWKGVDFKKTLSRISLFQVSQRKMGKAWWANSESISRPTSEFLNTISQHFTRRPENRRALGHQAQRQGPAPGLQTPRPAGTDLGPKGFLLRLGRTLGKICIAGLDPTQVPRNEDPRLKSASVFLDAMESKPQHQDWVANPKNKKNRP